MAADAMHASRKSRSAILREGDIEEVYDPQQRKAETGFGRRQSLQRGL